MQPSVCTARGWAGEVSVTAHSAHHHKAVRTLGEGRCGPLRQEPQDSCKGGESCSMHSSCAKACRLLIPTVPCLLCGGLLVQGAGETTPSTVRLRSHEGCGPCRRTGCCSRCLRTSPRTSMWQSCGTAASALHWKARGCAPPQQRLGCQLITHRDAGYICRARTACELTWPACRTVWAGRSVNGGKEKVGRPAIAAWRQLSSPPGRHRFRPLPCVLRGFLFQPGMPAGTGMAASWCSDQGDALQDPPFKRTRLLPLSPPRSRGWLLSSPISPGLLTRSQSGKMR